MSIKTAIFFKKNIELIENTLKTTHRTKIAQFQQ